MNLASSPPYPTGPDALFVAYYASAEISCHLALGWPVPERVLDLFTDSATSRTAYPRAAAPACSAHLPSMVLDGIGTVEKDEMRALVLRGGPWSDAERAAILDYCESDVAALARLLPAMLPSIDLPRALLRGRYMVAAARMERNGVPIDVATLGRLKRHWHDIQDRLIADIDADYGVFDGRTFKADRFAAWLSPRLAFPWPRLASGRLDLSDDAFREAGARASSGRALARVAKRPVRNAAVRSGRGPGRPQPHAPVGVPGAHRPQPAEQHQVHFRPERLASRLDPTATGHGVAYIDWAQQEFGIAAALSGDPLMLDAYRSGDPYLAFAKQAGAAPADATKATHKAVRDQFKACVLAVQYGMGADALAQRIGQPPIRARELLRLHRETYRVFWRWSDAAVDHAMLTGQPAYGVRLAGAGAGGTECPLACAISRCRRMAPKCCGWRAALAPSAASRSARRSMTRC